MSVTDKGLYERHLQTTIQIIIIAILMWFGNKTIITSDTVIRLSLQVETLHKEIVDLQSGFTSFKGNHYTERDVINDKKLDELQETIQANRITHLENSVKEIRDYLAAETNWKRGGDQ